MKIIMLGAPGAGKGTQAAKISEKYHLPHISTGDIFRANIKEGTELGLKAKSYIDQGALVPDELTVDLVISRISEPDCKNGYILDGFPRTIPQAECFDKALAENHENLEFAIDVEVPDDHIVSRMAGRFSCPECGAVYHSVHLKPKKEGLCDHCGTGLVRRKDDEPETVLHRLEVYHESTQPLIQHYDKKNILKRVDGTQPTEVVFATIEKILGE